MEARVLESPAVSRRRPMVPVVASTFQIADSALGRLLLVASQAGVQAVALADEDGDFDTFLTDYFPSSERADDDPTRLSWMRSVVAFLSGKTPLPTLPLDAAGTPFQKEVWRHLQQIPPGTTISYRTLADRMGRPKAVRAVARACGANPIAILVPCHRVVGSDGSLTGYRWGIERKKRLLQIEGLPTFP